jgi:hypothetical protein
VNYRPITDVWILARPKVKYHGAYPAGFLHRARALLGVGDNGAVLHVCAGKVRDYPYRGFGFFDRTLDLDPETKPDFLQDARLPFPQNCDAVDSSIWLGWDAVLIDRPYTEEDAAKYAPGAGVLPSANQLVKHAINVLPVGAKVGILDYVWPQPPKNATEVAVVAVGCGRNQKARWFTVFERVS